MQLFTIKIKKTWGLYWFPAIFIFMAWALITGCSPKTQDPALRPDPILTQEKPFGPAMSFKELMEQNLSRQYSPPETIFEPDDPPPHHGLMVINREKPVVTLARGVSSFAGGPDFLAAGFHDGNISIWSRFPCPMLTLPQKEPVKKIWWDGQSPYICASGSNTSLAHIYDLGRCARIADIAVEGMVEKMTVSPRGNHVALVDQGGRLWTGNLNGELTRRATLRFAPLQASFTPGEGVLMISDSAGWLVLWTVPDYEIMEQIQIPNGPFSEALFDGPILLLKGLDHAHVSAWDIPAGQSAETGPDRGEFILENGVLYYVMPEEKNLKKMLMTKPEFIVSADSEQMILRVLDLDGQKRYYNARTGNEKKEAGEFMENQVIEVSVHAIFLWAGTGYALADPVLVTDKWALWSRFIPGQGHYLWWSANNGLEQKDFTGELPHRINIRKEIPPDWIMLKHKGNQNE